MADDLNPYRVPDAPIAEDFIAIEPRRRSTGAFITAACCHGAAALVLSFSGFMGYLLTTYPPATPPPVSRTLLILTPVACATLAFLLAGRAFWRMHNRQGVIFFLTATGALASIFLLPFLIR